MERQSKTTGLITIRRWERRWGLTGLSSKGHSPRTTGVCHQSQRLVLTLAYFQDTLLTQ